MGRGMEALLKMFRKQAATDSTRQVPLDHSARVAGEPGALKGAILKWFLKPGSADAPAPSSRAMSQFEKIRRQVSLDDVTRVDGKLGGFNRGPVMKVWGTVQSLFTFVRESDAGWDKKAMALAALVYLVSPLDAIPDFIPGVGLLDDVSIILLVGGILAALIKQYMVKPAVEAVATVAIKEHYRKAIVWVLSSIVIASLGLLLVPDTEPLRNYRMLLSVVSIVTTAIGLYQARHWFARYKRLPRSWQQAVKEGAFSATRRFLREEWAKVVLLVFLLLVLAGLNVAIYRPQPGEPVHDTSVSAAPAAR